MSWHCGNGLRLYTRCARRIYASVNTNVQSAHAFHGISSWIRFGRFIIFRFAIQLMILHCAMNWFALLWCDGREKTGQNRRQIQNLPRIPIACQMCPPRGNCCRAFWFTKRGPWRRSSLSIKSLWNITCLQCLWRAWIRIANWAPLGDAWMSLFNHALFRLSFSHPVVQRLNENVHLLRILRYLRNKKSNDGCPITYY